MLIPQIDTLTEQQAMGICNLQRSSQETEDALYQGLEQLQHSLIITIAGTAVVDGINHMALAAGKLSNLEGFIRQVTLTSSLFLSLINILSCFVIIWCLKVFNFIFYNFIKSLKKFNNVFGFF